MRLGETEWATLDGQALNRTAATLSFCAAAFLCGAVVSVLLYDAGSAALALGGCVFSAGTAFVLHWIAAEWEKDAYATRSKTLRGAAEADSDLTTPLDLR